MVAPCDGALSLRNQNLLLIQTLSGLKGPLKIIGHPLGQFNYLAPMLDLCSAQKTLC